ncbi:MAG: DNA-binding response regulator, partial [Muribaculaceae bacterium]|nr:DNA-binding response regulator [Muribaculaceae bacterium]
ITKPWDNDQLIEKLRKAIDKNRQVRQDKETARRASQLEAIESERLRLTLDEVKMRHIRSVIDSCGGNLSAAAQQLGVNRQTLYNLLKK